MTRRGFKDILDLPKNSLREQDVYGLISLYLATDTRFAGSDRSGISDEKLKMIQQAYPTLKLRDALLSFGFERKNSVGKSNYIPIVELGWFHMPGEYNRLNIYSGLIRESVVNTKGRREAVVKNVDHTKIEKFVGALAHLYTEAINTHKPLIGKFAVNVDDSRIRLCSYVDDNRMKWQLKNLSEHYREPLKLTDIVQHNNSTEYFFFSGKQVGVRVTGEATGMSHEQYERKKKSLKEAIGSLHENT